ncbi:hypothetical protein ACP4OV_010840 [Aristida adscensionis]
MSQRSKREMAPPPSQPPAPQPPTPPSPFLPPPWWGAPPPHAPFPPFPMSCESMASPPGLWSGNPYAYGAQSGAAAMGDGLRVQDASGNGKVDSESLDCPPGGFLNFLQNGHHSVSAASPPSGSIDQGATLRSKTKTVINVDGGDDVRTEKRLSWTPEEDVRLRPMGTKEAKKQRNGKGKIKVEDPSLDEDLKKYMDIQAAAKKRHDDFLETQKCVSDAKVEAARLNREAALLESYKSLLTMDTKEMTDEMKAEHVMGLKILREKLLGNTG